MNKKFKRLLIVLFIFYFILQFFSLRIAKKDQPSFHEKVIVAVTAPVQWVVYSAYKGITDTISSYFFLVNVKKVNQQLNEEISQLRHKLIDAKELEHENFRLKRMFNLQVGASYRRVMAKRIAYGSSRFERSIRIQKGVRHGIEKGYPVLTVDGVVGQVVEVYRSYSDVLLITDPTSSIDVIIQRSRDNGILKGARKNQLHFEFLSKESDIFEEDVVISSGLDGIYPKGFPIGKVSAVGVRTRGLFLEATVKPFVDFEDIEEVIVLIPMKVAQ